MSPTRWRRTRARASARSGSTAAPPPAKPAERPLRAAECREALGAGALDQGFDARPHESLGLLDAGQLAGACDQGLVELQRDSHGHRYASPDGITRGDPLTTEGT